jgi:hypothetical protein
MRNYRRGHDGGTLTARSGHATSEQLEACQQSVTPETAISTSRNVSGTLWERHLIRLTLWKRHSYAPRDVTRHVTPA